MNRYVLFADDDRYETYWTGETKDGVPVTDRSIGAAKTFPSARAAYDEAGVLSGFTVANFKQKTIPPMEVCMCRRLSLFRAAAR